MTRHRVTVRFTGTLTFDTLSEQSVAEELVREAGVEMLLEALSEADLWVGGDDALEVINVEPHPPGQAWDISAPVCACQSDPTHPGCFAFGCRVE
ncbi:hypothetical protein SAMN02983003_0602 [Devosia enhydra]|uniref:Uncharacterized protein n=1 Tax=Devosia enhydra TaxID=665118 RepID=A0A1K2HU27_9HYPH|nr:hypothetical protein [Devosia enhydra]SFZ81627.1 hypothetical protein SAMN02983003_0602 [Devosia enhydra]